MPSNLLDALAEVEALARQTRLNLAAGLATTGVSGLIQIEQRAADAARHHRERRGETPTPIAGGHR